MNKIKLKREMIVGLALSIGQVLEYYEREIFDSMKNQEEWKHFLYRRIQVFENLIEECIEEYVIWDNVPGDLSTPFQPNTIGDILKKNHWVLTDDGPDGNVWRKFPKVQDIEEIEKCRLINFAKDLVTNASINTVYETTVCPDLARLYDLKTSIRDIFNELMDLRGVPYIINPYSLRHSQDEPLTEGR